MAFGLSDETIVTELPFVVTTEGPVVDKCSARISKSSIRNSRSGNAVMNPGANSVTGFSIDSTTLSAARLTVNHEQYSQSCLYFYFVHRKFSICAAILLP